MRTGKIFCVALFSLLICFALCVAPAQGACSSCSSCSSSSPGVGSGITVPGAPNPGPEGPCPSKMPGHDTGTVGQEYAEETTDKGPCELCGGPKRCEEDPECPPRRYVPGEEGADYFADPVTVPSGSLVEDVVDLELPGPGCPFRLVRHYNSGLASGSVYEITANDLGEGWHSSMYNAMCDEPADFYTTPQEFEYVDECGNTHIGYTEPEPIDQMRVFYLYGKSVRFTRNANIYHALPPQKETIDVSGGEMILNFTDGSQWYYEPIEPTTEHYYRITKAVDRYENTMTFQYGCDMGFALTKVVDTAGREHQFMYETFTGLLTKVTDSAGRSVTYEYNGRLLTRVIDPENRITNYEYHFSPPGFSYGISKKTDQNNREAYTNYYDSDGRITTQSMNYGNYGFVYSGVGGLTCTTSSPYGEQQVWNYSDEDNTIGLVNKTVMTNRGIRGDEPDYSTGYEYDSTSKIASTHYSPSGLNEGYILDAGHNMVSRRVVNGAQAVSYGYAYGGTYTRLTAYRKPGGGLYTYERDALARMTRHVQPTVSKGQSAAQSIATTYAFNGYGKVTREVDPLGVVTAYTYDNCGLLRTKLVDAGGMNILSQYLYDAAGNLTETIDPEGKKEWFYWDKTALLTKAVKILDNSDTTKQYAVSYYYDSCKHLTSKVVDHKDQAGTALSPATYSIKYESDVHGNNTRVIYDLDGTNKITTDYIFDGTMRVTKVTNPNGTQEAYAYDERYLLYQKQNCAGCGSSAISYDYNGNGDLTKQTDAKGFSTIYTMDGLNNVTRTAYYDATPTLLSYEEALYDDDNNVTQRTNRDASDNIVGRATYYYDEVNRLYETREWANPTSAPGDSDARQVMMYDAASRMTKQKSLLAGSDASPVWAETSYYYDNAGRQTRVVNAEGAILSYYYDKEGKLTRQTDAENHSTDYAYDLLGRMTRTTNAAGHYTVTEYDSNGNALTTISYASGGTALAKSAMDYDCLGRVTLQRQFADPTGAASETHDYKSVTWYDGNGLVTKSEDALGNLTTAYYDTHNRLEWQRNPLGNKVELAYDNNNNKITSISYEIDQVNGATKSFTTAVLYDGRNRATRQVGQGTDGDITASTDNPITSVYYNALGRQTKTTDPNDVATVWLYHSLSRVTRQVEDYGGIGRKIDYAHDRAGRMTKISDDLDQSTDYAYDKLSRLTRTSYEDHDGSPDTVDQLYSADGRITKRIDQRNIQTVYLYDILGKLTKKQDDPASPNTVEEYAHDALGRMTLAKLTRGGTEHSDVRYYYDGLSRSTRESQTIKTGTARNIDYAYDKAGNRTSLTYPGGKVASYGYDTLSRVSRILDDSSERAVYNYVGSQRRSQVALKNGASTVSMYKLSYDGMARITSALYRNAADDATIVGFEHAWDKVGNPQYEIRTHQSSYGDAYMYDKLHRVTRVIYDDADPANSTYAVARTEDFLLDPIGNRTKLYAKSATATEYLHNPVNEYTSVGGTGYEYDAAGNLTKDDTHYYFWDYENRLTKVKLVSDSSDVAEYAYDATMRRIEKTDYTADPDITTRFYYDSWSDIEERTWDVESETVAATYVNGPTIDNYVTMNRGGNTYWYCQTPIVGNVVALLNSSGAIQEGYKYDAYGKVTVLTGTGNDATWFTSDDTTADVSALGNPFAFTGRRLDAETGLIYFRFRMYNPILGIFASCDPEGYVDGMSVRLGYFAPVGRDSFGLATDPNILKAVEEFAKEFGNKGVTAIGGNKYRVNGTNYEIRVDIKDAKHKLPHMKVTHKYSNNTWHRNFDISTGKVLTVSAVIGWQILHAGIKATETFSDENSKCNCWYKRVLSEDISGAKEVIKDCAMDIALQGGSGTLAINVEGALTELTDRIEQAYAEYAVQVPATEPTGPAEKKEK